MMSGILEDKEAARVEVFSDGVFAIAIYFGAMCYARE